MCDITYSTLFTISCIK